MSYQNYIRPKIITMDNLKDLIGKYLAGRQRQENIVKEYEILMEIFLKFCLEPLLSQMQMSITNTFRLQKKNKKNFWDMIYQ
jgi:hypothetical protein